MKQIKYIVLFLFILLNIHLLFCQQKIFDSILDKVEKNVDKNYYTDSISAVRHSEYVINDSTKEFLKVVCIEYFPTPIWAIDGKFYHQKYGFNDSVFSRKLIGYLITAKLYKKDESNNLGFTNPHRFGSSYSHIDICDFNSTVSTLVWRNRDKGSFLNLDNILTLEIRTPINKVFSLDNTKILTNDFSIMSLANNTYIQNSTYIKYEDFCKRVDHLDDAMLLDWNNYEMGLKYIN